MDLIQPPIILSENDFQEIWKYAQGVGPASEALRSELDRAEVLSESAIPPDVVRLGSKVTYSEGDITHNVQVVLPHLADLSEGKVSILAAIGSALIGIRKGEAIDWPMPGGKVKTIRILDVQSA